MIEWFYSEEKGERYVDGARLIGPLIPDFDYKKGKQHNLTTILQLPRWPIPVLDVEENRQHLLSHWTQILTFDTIIGNADRHPENWGAVSWSDPEGSPIRTRLSPAFDNGTALSYEQLENNFFKFNDEEYLVRYLTRARRARHHMQWSLDDTGDMNFFDFMRKFVREFPQTKGLILGKLQFNESDLRARLDGLPGIPVGGEWRLTPQRLDFTLKLVMKRVSLLKEALENV